MSLKTAFARELYRARTKSGYSPAQIANAAGISLRWYQYLEKGTRMPSAAVLLRLMSLLALEVNDFHDFVGIKSWRLFHSVEQHLYSPETGNYVTYGIRVSSEGGESLLIDDVSCDRIFAEALAARCTQLQISPAQLYSAAIDQLNRFGQNRARADCINYHVGFAPPLRFQGLRHRAVLHVNH